VVWVLRAALLLGSGGTYLEAQIQNTGQVNVSSIAPATIPQPSLGLTMISNVGRIISPKSTIMPVDGVRMMDGRDDNHTIRNNPLSFRSFRDPWSFFLYITTWMTANHDLLDALMHHKSKDCGQHAKLHETF
jgi:hypothetical protein